MKTMKKLGEMTLIGVESGLSMTLLHIALASTKFSKVCAKAGAKLGADMAERAVRSEFASDAAKAEMREKLQGIYEAMADIG